MNLTVLWKKIVRFIWKINFHSQTCGFNQASSQTVILGLYILYVHSLQKDVIKVW